MVGFSFDILDIFSFTSQRGVKALYDLITQGEHDMYRALHMHSSIVDW